MLKGVEATTMKLLLHACCGPCSLEPVRLLKERNLVPTIFYSNSNIHPEEEYEHRRDTLAQWADQEDLRVIEDVYNKDIWEERVGVIGEHALAEARNTASEEEAAQRGLTPELLTSISVEPQKRMARCRACYRLRFEALAEYAHDHGFDTIGTTLSVSPYQYTDVIEEELERAAHQADIQALFEDYRPYYPQATQRSRDAGMYRQNFCGCRFSEIEAEAERVERKFLRDQAKAQKAAANAERNQALKEQQATRKQEKAEYAKKQAQKHAILKALREQQKEETRENE